LCEKHFQLPATKKGIRKL